MALYCMGKVTKPHTILYIIIFLLLSSQTKAQTQEKQSLITLLSELETQYNIRFSFVTDQITALEVIPPDKNLTLEQALKYLSTKTKLEFNNIDQRYIAVVKKEEALISFCAFIIDTFSQDGLAAATIQVDGSNIATITDNSGKFTLNSIPKSSVLTIRYLGYKPIKLVPDKFKHTGNCAQIKLVPKVRELEQISLRSFLTKGIDKKYNGSVVLNADRIGILPSLAEPDILQMIQALPGIKSVDERVSNINIRGGTHDENLILWDDIKMYQSGHFFGLISAFNPYMTKKAIVYKNGTNPRYGEGVSGIIDIRSENRVLNHFSGALGFNLINGTAFANIPITKNFSLQVSGRKSINELFTSPTQDQFFNRIFQNTKITQLNNNTTEDEITAKVDFSFFDVGIKALYNPTDLDKIRLNFLTIDNSLKFTETLRTELTLNSKTSDLKQQNFVGGLSWERQWSDKLVSKALIFGSNYLLKANNLDVLTEQRVLQDNEVLEYGIKLDVDYFLNKKITLAAGYQLIETGISNTQDVNIPNFRSFIKEVLLKHSIYTNFSFSSQNKKTIANAGLRVNYIQKFDTLLIEPRLTLYHKLNKKIAIEAQAEFKNQTTSQRIDFQSDFLGIENRRWILVNNKDVPIIRSKQASLGVVYKNRGWFLNAEAFIKKVKGITTTNQGFQNQFQFIKSQGSYEVKGVEFVVQKKINNFDTWFSYSYTKNDYTFKSLTPSRFPSNQDISHTATLATAYTYNRLKIALGLNFHTGRPFTIPVPGDETVFKGFETQVNFDTPNDQNLNNYLRADLSGEYNFTISNKLKGKLNLALINLFNRKNTLNIYYIIKSDDEGVPKVNEIKQYSLGFTPNFSFQVIF